MKVISLDLAPGLNFGRDGRYSIIKKLGKGWEGEVYVAVKRGTRSLGWSESDAQAVKFRRVPGNPTPVAPTWDSDYIWVTNKSAKGQQIPEADLIWHEFMDEGDKDGFHAMLECTGRQFEFSTGAAGKEITLTPKLLEYGVVALPDAGNLSACIYEVMEFLGGKLLPDLLAEHVTGRPQKANACLQGYAESLLRTLLEGAHDYQRAGYGIINDLHAENIICDDQSAQSSFRLIDAALMPCDAPREECLEMSCQEALESFIKSAMLLALQVLHWDMIGLSVLAHNQDAIHLEYLASCKNLRAAVPRPFSNECLDQVNALTKQMGFLEPFTTCLMVR